MLGNKIWLLKLSTTSASLLFVTLVLAKLELPANTLDYTLLQKILRDTTPRERTQISRKLEPGYLILEVTLSIAFLNFAALHNVRKNGQPPALQTTG